MSRVTPIGWVSIKLQRWADARRAEKLIRQANTLLERAGRANADAQQALAEAQLLVDEAQLLVAALLPGVPDEQ